MVVSVHICCASGDVKPNSVYEQAAKKLVIGLPTSMKYQQLISSDKLAVQLQEVVPKRVENQTLIEDILHQDLPLKSEGTALLLLQINSMEGERYKYDLQDRESHYTKQLAIFFGLSLATLAAVLSNS